MALAGFLIALLFQVLGLTPAHTAVAALESRPTWNYTTLLDFAFLVLMAVLAWRFLMTGGPDMLRMMNRPVGQGHDHMPEHAHHDMGHGGDMHDHHAMEE